jgi:hypothetical protein
MFVITLTTKHEFDPMEGEAHSFVVLHIAGDGIKSPAEVEQMVYQLDHMKKLLEE